MHKNDSVFIKKLSKELNDTEYQIKKLISERNFLQDIINREISSINNENYSIRKNSKQKIITQSNIVKTLSNEVSEKKVSELYEKCAKDSHISKSSFRNYLSDLSDRDIIKRGSKSGYWKINPSERLDFSDDSF